MECEAVGASIMNTLVRNPITIPQTCTWRVCVSFLSDFLCIWLPLWSMHTIIIEPCSVLLLSHELRLNTYFLWGKTSVYFYFFAFSVSFVIHFFIFFNHMLSSIAWLSTGRLQVPIWSVTEFKGETETETRTRLPHNTSQTRCVHYELQCLHSGISA